MAQIVKNIMNTSMRYAVNKGLITDNPATDVLMKNDFNLKATSKILGHAKEIVTADIYVDNQENIDDGVGELKEYMDEVVPQRPTDFNEKERVFDYSDFDVTAAFDDLTL